MKIKRLSNEPSCVWYSIHASTHQAKKWIIWRIVFCKATLIMTLPLATWSKYYTTDGIPDLVIQILIYNQNALRRARRTRQTIPSFDDMTGKDFTPKNFQLKETTASISFKTKMKTKNVIRAIVHNFNTQYSNNSAVIHYNCGRRRNIQPHCRFRPRDKEVPRRNDHSRENNCCPH